MSARYKYVVEKITELAASNVGVKFMESEVGHDFIILITAVKDIEGQSDKYKEALLEIKKMGGEQAEIASEVLAPRRKLELLQPSSSSSSSSSS